MNKVSQRPDNLFGEEVQGIEAQIAEFCGVRDGQAMLKQFHFSGSGNYRHSSQAVVPLTELQPADSAQVRLVKSQALRAFCGHRPDVPKPVFEILAGPERTAEVMSQLLGRTPKQKPIINPGGFNHVNYR